MNFTGLLPEETERAAAMLKTIHHSLRWAIFSKRSNGNRLSVTEIHNLFGIEQSTTSHHFVRCISECICAN